MSQKLSLFDDDSDSEIQLSINKDYANNYNRWREGEERQKYKDLMKDEEDSDSSSESEEVDEEFDEEFFRALSLVKSKDPRLYDKNFQLFKEKEIAKKPKVKKEKPMYMKDYERKLVLERGGKFSDEDDEENKLEKIPTYKEEQENLKKSFKEAVGDSDDSDHDDNLLQVKTKTKKEEEVEEADYVKWLKGQEVDIPEDVKKDLSYLRNYWNDPELNEDEKFLRDFFLNYRHSEKEDSDVPAYDEITSGMLSDDEKMIEKQEEFEHKYNFRFEEPDEEYIKRYPRTIGDSLRRVDNRRKEKREEKAERKRKEREQRREELKRLKALKRKEIEEKFMKLKEISGKDEINLNESDIESDFDPDKHDQRMNEMFNDDYYQVEEQQKPEFPSDEELDSENWNAWTGEKSIENNETDENDESDKDENTTDHDKSSTNPKDEFVNEMINACRPKKKVKKKSLFAKIISQPKPVYDPDGKSFDEYLDEYYKLDYEDVVGDMPVRYKYRKVIPNDFGLTVEEIFAADDRELNRWCSVKKACQYRNEEEELYDVQAFSKKAQIPHIKQKCLPSVYAAKTVDDSNVFDCKISNKKNISNQVNSNAGNFEREEFKSENNIQQCKNDKIIDKSFENTSVYDNVENDKDVEQSPKNVKKLKKRKHKEMQNITECATESEITNVISESMHKNSDAEESLISLKTSHKSNKKKRKHNDDSIDSKEDNVPENVSPKLKKKRLSDPNETTFSNSEIIPEASTSEITSDAPSKKKKKKKKKKHKEDNKSNAQYHTSDQFNNASNGKHKSKDRHKKWASEDKRLGLSDERLAAYGINPKKFKNKIIYSKK